MSQIQEDLRKWFKEKWVRFDTEGNIKGECARDEGEGKPKCLPMEKAQAIGKKARAQAAKRKRKEDPEAERKGKAKFVATESMDFDPEELEKARKMLTGKLPEPKAGAMSVKGLIAMHKKMHTPSNVNTKGPYNPVVKEDYLEEKNEPTNPKLWSQAIAMVKKKFKIYPSAYANAAAAKWYKSKGGGWKTMKEDTRLNTKILFMESLGYEIAEAKVEQDHEKEMARTQLRTACDAIKRLMKKIGSGEGQLEAWVQSKLTKAVDYIDSVADYMDNNDKEIKEAIELADMAREFVSEDYHKKKPKASKNEKEDLRKEEYGAGDMGTCELTDKYKEQTPGQTIKSKRKKK